MSKTIEQAFSKKINVYNYYITARNYNDHLFSIDGEKSHSITTDEMKKLASFLNECAFSIENDKDFSKKQS